jgi:hypothetical protein
MGSAGPIAMSLHATARWLGMEENALRETIRKTAIVSILIGLLIPPFLLNLGVAVKGRLSYLSQGFSPFRELLLCQQWTLFGYVVPFNFNMQFEVELRDGRVVVLRDLVKERAGKWQPVLFHNERKTQLNLYANRPALRYYFEYLIWLNEIDPSQVVRRTIYLRYRDVLPRNEATATGIYFGPESKYVLDQF